MCVAQWDRPSFPLFMLLYAPGRRIHVHSNGSVNYLEVARLVSPAGTGVQSDAVGLYSRYMRARAQSTVARTKPGTRTRGVCHLYPQSMGHSTTAVDSSLACPLSSSTMPNRFAEAPLVNYNQLYQSVSNKTSREPTSLD